MGYGSEPRASPSSRRSSPQHWVAKAGLDALLRWIRDGEEPPSGEPIETTGPEGTTVVRDERGLALGGIRMPSVDVRCRR